MIVEYLTISFDTIFRIFMGRMSGPDAFKGFKLLSNFSMPGTVNNMSGTVETVSPSISVSLSSCSLVNCDVYWVFRDSAFSTGILLSSDFFCMMLIFRMLNCRYSLCGSFAVNL